MENVLELTETTFDEKISKGVVLVDFWASWCGPCKMIAPVLEEVAAEIGDKAVIAKISVEEYPGVAQKFSIMNIPAIFIFKDGEVVEQFLGVLDKATLVGAIERALSQAATD